LRQALAYGSRAGAERARAFIVKETPGDLGQLRASWKIEQTYAAQVERAILSTDGTLASLINDAPHAAVVEFGAKPHGVSAEGWQAIYEWARRHARDARGRMRPRPRGGDSGRPFTGPDPVITGITNAIVHKLRTQGQRPRLFIRNNLGMMRYLMATELAHAIERALRNARPGRV
jgi:hypothetical protein